MESKQAVYLTFKRELLNFISCMDECSRRMELAFGDNENFSQRYLAVIAKEICRAKGNPDINSRAYLCLETDGEVVQAILVYDEDCIPFEDEDDYDEVTAEKWNALVEQREPRLPQWMDPESLSEPQVIRARVSDMRRVMEIVNFLNYWTPSFRGIPHREMLRRVKKDARYAIEYMGVLDEESIGGDVSDMEE